MNLYNTLTEKFLLPFGDFVLKSNFMRRVEEIRNTVALTEQSIMALQRKRLEETLTFATKNSEYYRALKLIEKPNPTEWLKDFPILDKPTLNKNVDAILTQPKHSLIKNASSGSSGIQTVGYYSKNEMDTFRAIQTVFWEWGGYHLGDKIIQTGMALNRSKVKKVKDFLLRTKYILAFNPDPKKVAKVFEQAQGKEYGFLGYASSLYVFAKLAEEMGMKGPHFKYAICWGDKLFDHYRDSVRQQFGCEVTETYGAAEGFQMAGQKDLPYMYLMAPEVYMEIVDDNGNEVADGTLGHVIVTNLRTTAMPMIRYRIGDLAVKLPKSKYPPNRDLQLPLLQRVVGRDTDIVRTPAGKRLIVHTFTGVIEYYPEILQFRIVQRILPEIEIEYIPSEGFDRAVLHRISVHLKKAIQDPTLAWKFVEVKEIPNTPSGKPQIILSLLPKGTLTK